MKRSALLVSILVIVVVLIAACYALYRAGIPMATVLTTVSTSLISAVPRSTIPTVSISTTLAYS